MFDVSLAQGTGVSSRQEVAHLILIGYNSSMKLGHFKVFSLVFSLLFGTNISVLCSVESIDAAKTPLASLEHLAIPASLGKVESRFHGASPRRIIHIQDVHAHLTAQENIAAIVDHLNAVYGIKTVAIEGGWGATNFPVSWGLPNSRAKQMLARALLEEDYITGPAHAALFSSSPILLVGIEDRKLYDDNRQIYLRHLSQRDKIQSKVDSLVGKISTLKSTVYSPELLAFDHALSDFREGKKADKFIPTLLSIALTAGVNLGGLNQVLLFQQVLQKEFLLDKQKLEGEAKRLMQSFRRERMNFEELLRSGKIPGDKLEFYPETVKYLELIRLQDKITHRQFFLEIDIAVERLKEKVIGSEAGKNLDRRSEALLLAKKIILFQATPDDLKSFNLKKDHIMADLQDAGLDEALELGLNFYAIASDRDNVFFEKITSDPRLQGDIAVVTGGFHTEGLSARFENIGLSYTVITPDLGKELPNEELYFKRLQESIVPTQALAETNDRVFIIFGGGDAAFPSGVAQVAERNDILLGVQTVLQIMKGAARVIPSKDAMTPEKFIVIPEAMRDETVLARIQSVKTGSLPMAILGSQVDLIEQGETALRAFIRLGQNPAMRLFVTIPPDGTRHEATLGTRARVIPIDGISNIESVADLPPHIQRQLSKEKTAGAINVVPLKGLVTLPPRSQVDALILQWVLEGGLNLENSTSQTIAEFVRLFEESAARLLLETAA